MAELSPAAQAVWNAAWVNTPVQCGDIEGTRRAQVAAALRAAVAEVRTDRELKRHYAATMSEMLVLDKLLAIATELENHQ